MVIDFDLLTLVSTLPVNQGAGWADLHAGSTGDTGALSEGNVVISNQQAVGTAFLKAKGEIANQLTTSTGAAAAEDTAIVIEDDEWM